MSKQPFPCTTDNSFHGSSSPDSHYSKRPFVIRSMGFLSSAFIIFSLSDSLGDLLPSGPSLFHSKILVDVCAVYGM